MDGFDFARDRPHDLIVTSWAHGHESAPPRIRLYYTIDGVSSNFSYELASPKYGHDPDRMYDDIATAMLAEVCMRVKNERDFAVWYFSDSVRSGIEAACSRRILQDEAQKPFAEELSRRGRLAGGTDN